MGCLIAAVLPRSRSVWLKVSAFLFMHLRSHWGRLVRSKSSPNRPKNLSSSASIFSTTSMSWIVTCIRVAIKAPSGTLTCLVHRFRTSNSTKRLPWPTATTVGVTSTPPASYSPMPLTKTTWAGRGVSIFTLPDTLRPSPGAKTTALCNRTLQTTLLFFFRCFWTVWTADKAKCIALGNLAFWANRTPWTSTRSSRVLRRTFVPMSTGTRLLYSVSSTTRNGNVAGSDPGSLMSTSVYPL